YTRFFLPDLSPTGLYTLSLHDALPICGPDESSRERGCGRSATRWRTRRRARGSSRNASGPTRCVQSDVPARRAPRSGSIPAAARSEEHTSELQSLAYLVCRLLLEKKNS